MIYDKLEEISNLISNTLKKNITINNFQIVSGGCINSAYQIETNYGSFFLKYNNNSVDNLFAAEAKGLSLLRNTNTIMIPHVIFYNDDFIIMDFINNSVQNNSSWESFGRNLADLHRISESYFGLDYDNFIGSLKQRNNKKDNWVDFFLNERILPQLNLNKNCFPSNTLKMFDRLFTKTEDLFPVEKPSLLHGDLWSGNFLMNKDRAFVFDPAVYFGFREMDIAMSKLFGGFDEFFYSSYNESYPLYNGWKDRVKLCNLYPLLVHVNLFGGHYYDQLTHNLKKIV